MLVIVGHRVSDEKGKQKMSGGQRVQSRKEVTVMRQDSGCHFG